MSVRQAIMVNVVKRRSTLVLVTRVRTMESVRSKTAKTCLEALCKFISLFIHGIQSKCITIYTGRLLPT